MKTPTRTPFFIQRAPPQSWFRRSHIFARCLLMCGEDLEYDSWGKDERECFWTFGENGKVPNVMPIWDRHWGPELSITRGHVGPGGSGLVDGGTRESARARSLHTVGIGGAAWGATLDHVQDDMEQRGAGFIHSQYTWATAFIWLNGEKCWDVLVPRYGENIVKSETHLISRHINSKPSNPLPDWRV